MSQIKIQVYEPPMCCPTGVCGPSVDDKLVEFSNALEELKKEGIEVERNAMNHNPFAFQENQSVLDVVNDQGTEELPITEINGEVIKFGEYPSLEELRTEIEKIKEAN